VIALNPGTRYQVMSGWEATSQAGQSYSAAWSRYKDALFDRAAGEVGVNRLRVEVPSGSENPVDYFAQFRAGTISEDEWITRSYEIVNDNADPNSINPGGFTWSFLDDTVERVVLPMRQRLAARGEALRVSLCYVDFRSSAFEHKSNPAEYAEFVLAAYQHLQSKYGIVPDTWEVVLEPDAGSAAWSAPQVAQAVKAAGDRLAAAGYAPAFVAPSVTSVADFPSYVGAIGALPGAMPYVAELSYHRYGGATAAQLQGVASAAAQYGKRAAMLEYIGADYQMLHDDVKLANASAWQQYTLAFPGTSDDGGAYFMIGDADPANPSVNIGSRTRFLRQYFAYVRAGAQRIGASSNAAGFDPLAFVNPGGKYAVVVKATVPGSFSVQGLPAGTYGIKFTTASQYGVDLPSATIGSGQLLTTSIPAAGVITIYAL
jgi:hypothetical protein